MATETVELCDEKEAARRLGTSPARLRYWRLYRRSDLPVQTFYRLPSGAIKYDVADISRALAKARVAR